jgi:hypothetical protein
MVSRSVRIAVVVLMLWAGLADGAAAQNTGTITARVVDGAGAVVPGADVVLTDERTGAARTAVSDPRGDVQFVAMPPGVYSVRVSLQGFRTLERVGNVLTASGQLALGDLTLALGNLSEVITVESTGTKVETDNSDYSALLTSKQIEQIQTKGRDVMSLLRLLPGVRYENDIEAMGDSFGSNVPNVGGQRRAWNQVTVDGLNGNELSGTSRFSSAINLDAIAEVKVLLNTYKAEFGRSGGANIQIVSKSGSSDYSGGLYWYGRRDQWNATPWENNRNGLAKPKYHFDTYGATLGGPVVIPGLVSQRDDKKLFFFYSLEAPQVERPGPVRLYRMPTERERRGDFSQTFDLNGRLINIRDPQRTGACSVTTGGPGCFPGNVIPADRIDSSTRNLLDRLPLPNNSSARRARTTRGGTTSSVSTAAAYRTTSSACSGRSTRINTGPRSPRGLPSGGSSTAPISFPTARSTAAGRGSSAATSSTSCRPASAARPKASRRPMTGSGRTSCDPASDGRWGSSTPGSTSLA